MRTLYISYDSLPPSDNRIRGVGYTYVAGKKKAIIHYTREAEDYKKGLVRHINNVFFLSVQRFAREHRPESLYLLTTVLHFPLADILNVGWLNQTRAGKKGAQSPYKRLDVMNRRKLLEDCLSEAIGIDDSLFWEGANVKLVSSSGAAKVDMLLEEINPLHYGVPPEYLADGSHGR